jgi:hypothetical protein
VQENHPDEICERMQRDYNLSAEVSPHSLPMTFLALLSSSFSRASITAHSHPHSRPNSVGANCVCSCMTRARVADTGGFGEASIQRAALGNQIRTNQCAQQCGSDKVNRILLTELQCLPPPAVPDCVCAALPRRTATCSCMDRPTLWMSVST